MVPLTLVDRIEAAQSAPNGGFIRFVTGDESDVVPWARMLEDSVAMAARLQARGIGPGSHVALLGPTSRPLVTAIEATWLCGATLIVLPLPMRLASIEAFVAQTWARVANADVDLLVVDPDLVALVEPPPAAPPVVSLADLGAGGPGRRGVFPGRRHAGSGTARVGRWDRPAITPDSLAILQFTSGSTADPKGVMLPHRQICHNLDAMVTATQIDPASDVLVSWLPLYHDMGLIGLLTEAMTGALNLVLARPQDFLAAPARWLTWMSEFGGTLSAGPNFSYALVTRVLRRLAPGALDLSAWRLALNGAEPVDPATVQEFVDAAVPQGFDPRAALAVFGMAEATLGVTFPEPLSGIGVDVVDRRALEHERLAVPSSGERVRRLARLGRPVAGLEIRIVDPVSGRVMRQREAGELEVRGNSVTPGYYNKPDATAAAFHDGWLRTGDLGYLVDGELVVCGRLKDMIIVGGRNVFPEDVERAVAEVAGVRAGNVIAFGVERQPGREGIVVVAETRETDVPTIRAAVADRVRDAVGLPPEVVLVTPGTLPKTSSGKLQRSLCRSRYLEAELQLA
jgi:fatty-acyl-CoA synthase